MKRRLGFVSNSSTSSFVLLGIKKNAKEFTEEEYEDLWGVSGVIVDDGDVYMGEVLATGPDYDFTESVTSLEELNKKACAIAEQHGVSPRDISLYICDPYVPMPAKDEDNPRHKVSLGDLIWGPDIPMDGPIAKATEIMGT